MAVPSSASCTGWNLPYGFGFEVRGLRFSGVGFGIWGLGFAIHGSWSMIHGLWLMVYSLWFMIFDLLGFVIYGFWFMVHDFGLWFQGSPNNTYVFEMTVWLTSKRVESLLPGGGFVPAGTLSTWKIPDWQLEGLPTGRWIGAGTWGAAVSCTPLDFPNSHLPFSNNRWLGNRNRLSKRKNRLWENGIID